MSDETLVPADTAALAQKRGGRPSKARGAPMSSDAAEDRWTVRGVLPTLRAAAVQAAKDRNEPVGEWLSRAIHLALRPSSSNEGQANALMASVPVEDRFAAIETQLAGLAAMMEKMGGAAVARRPFWKRWSGE